MKRVIIKLNQINKMIHNRPTIAVIENENNSIYLEYGKDNVLEVDDATDMLVTTWKQEQNPPVVGRIILPNKKEIFIKVENCMDKNLVSFNIISISD